MAVIFISHSSADDELAARLVQLLRDEGLEAVFVDHDPDHGIALGEDWRKALEDRLRQAEVLVYLGTAAAAASPFCTLEISTALQLDIPIQPVQAEPGASNVLLDHLQWLRWSSDLDGALRLLVASVSQTLTARARRISWDARRPPFPGLRSFTPDDAGVFFGRDDVVDQIVTLINPPGAGDDDSVLMVQGASGVGKSSILGAGVVPAVLDLHRDGGPRWAVADRMHPGNEDPFVELALTIEKLFGPGGQDGIGMPVPALAKQLRSDPGQARVLLRSAAGRLDPPADRVLLLVDQAEELVGVPDDLRLEFLNTVGVTAEAGSHCAVVLTCRSAFVDQIVNGTGLGTRLRAVVVTPLGRADLPALIEGPARRAGLSLAPGLTGRLVEDTGDGQALPLLAYCLGTLYERSRHDGGREITEEDYRAVGGVTGSIAAQFEGLPIGTDRLVEVLLRLVEMDEAGRRRRRRVPFVSFTEDQQQIITQLEGRRLVARDEQNRIRVTHEAIFSAWHPLDEAITQRATQLMLRRRLDRLAAFWVANPTEADLLRGRRLEEAVEWRAGQPADEIAADTGALIDASLAQERRRQLARGATAAGVAGVVALLALIGILQLRAQARAATADRLASARQLVQRAQAAGRIDESAALALEALSASEDRETLAALAQSVFREPQVLGYLTGGQDEVRAVAFAPDGSILSGDATGRVVVWRPDGSLAADLGRSADGALVRSLTVAPGGTWAARSDTAGRIGVIDLATRSQRWLNGPEAGAVGHDGMVPAVRAVDDGRLLSVGVDGRTVLWSLDTGQPLWTATSAGRLWDADVDRGRGLVAVVGDAGLVEVRSLASGELVGAVTVADRRLAAVAWEHGTGALLVGGEDRAVTRVPVSTDGPGVLGGPKTLWAATAVVTSIASTGDGTVYVATSDGSVLARGSDGDVRRLVAHDRAAFVVAVAADEQRLAVASADGSISVHAIGPSGLINVLAGSPSDFLGAEDAAGTVYVTGSQARLSRFDPSTGAFDDVVTGLPAAVGDIAVDRGGTLAALGLADGTGLVVDLATGALWSAPVALGRIADAPASAVAVGPAGQVAMSGADRTVIVARSGEVREVEPVRRDSRELRIRALAWSADGSVLVGGGDGNAVVAWSAGTGTLLRQETHGPNETGVVVSLTTSGDVVYSVGNDQQIVAWALPGLERRAGRGFGQHRNIPNGVTRVAADALASVDNDGVLQVWDPTTGVSLLGPVRLPLRLGWRVVNGPKGTLLVLGRGGIVSVRADRAALLGQACALAASSDVGPSTRPVCNRPSRLGARLWTEEPPSGS